jgi:hypothetical protein
MRSFLRIVFCSLAVIVAGAGCHTQSHKSVRTYEYSDDASSERQSQHLGSEHEMQSPGTMESPGTMTNEPD